MTTLKSGPIDRNDDDPAAAGYVARAQELGLVVAADADEIERRRELPEGLRRRLIEEGLFRLLLPRSLGGAELPPPVFVEVIEEIAKADASTAWCLNQISGCSMTAAYLDPAAAREVFGAPDGILAWGPGPGEARVVAGGYQVTARFSFASGSHDASWLGAHLPIVEHDGRPRHHADGSPVVHTLLFPKSAARMTDIWHVVGLRGTGSDQYSVTDLFVPARFCVARDDPDARREPGLLYDFSALQLYASGFAAVAIGIARATLDAFVELARDKIPRGARHTLRDNNVVQSQVAQAEAKLGAARAFLFGALADITAEVARTRRLSLDQRMTIRLAATFAIHQAMAVVDTAYHAAGATAIFTTNPFERRFRDIHTVSQQLQGRQQHFETVGQYLMGLAPDTAWL
ncbi:MAG TPA: acyl-CoA dehydrogenase family protein [Stellaceae bacterium]|nr:acyl-CoA dehydrogenase family protein [Stellaceae bacterium]